jgi:hypothetical protein
LWTAAILRYKTRSDNTIPYLAEFSPPRNTVDDTKYIQW